jgi:hypothetical protein
MVHEPARSIRPSVAPFRGLSVIRLSPHSHGSAPLHRGVHSVGPPGLRFWAMNVSLVLGLGNCPLVSFGAVLVVSPGVRQPIATAAEAQIDKQNSTDLT